MQQISPQDITTMFLALAVLLGSAKLLGEVAQAIGQPSVIGEITAGILLGPGILGGISPKFYAALFPATGSFPLVLSVVSNIGVVFFLLTAGIEVDLSSVFRQAKSSLVISALGIVVPFAVGAATAGIFPEFMGMEKGANAIIFALFVGVALSISALPVIAKILMDLNLFHSEVGMLILGCAMLTDLAGWILFSLVLGMMTTHSTSLSELKHTILLTTLFVAGALTLGRWLVNKLLPVIQAHSTWPGGVLAFIFALTLGSAAFTEHAGIHAVFGAFIAGIVVGESRHLRRKTREHIHEVVTHVFAPFFFVSIGLQANFVKDFSLTLLLPLLLVACVGKLAGVGLGGRLAGLDQRTSWLVAFAMNARGAMEIILGLLAIQTHLIQGRMFVALVLVALLTSLLAAPVVGHMVRSERAVQLLESLSSKLFLPELQSRNSTEVIRRMCEMAAEAVEVPVERLFLPVWNRERNSPVWLFNGTAVLHTRAPGLEKPLVVAGLNKRGVHFGSRDDETACLVLLIVSGDARSQLELMRDAGRIFRRRETVEKALDATNFVEFAAAINAPADEKETAAQAPR
ncbi:MAG TPA: cation:proton antiporter [Terriglobia bacterium]|nr:cation:proton antiporter [Terriglobia bacterium]